MYKEFFGLSRNPFEISPDPYFLYATSRHNEALASILHGVLRHKGFIVVTGEVGTGKTMLVRCLLEMLRKHDIASANVFNPALTTLEFLRYVAADFGLKVSSQDKGLLLMELNTYLIARHRHNQTTVLIVDEAQHLEYELLEEIRLLTNLETSQQKLLQIVLVGQPELDQKMDSPQLRQLKQRAALRCRLEPLREEETQGYILRRMQRAGAAEGNKIFPAAVIAAVHRYSRGVPRLINTISENALIIAYAEKSPSITAEMIDEVARDLHLNVVTRVPEPSSSFAGQQEIARSLLQLIDTLHRAVQVPLPGDPTSKPGVKII